MRVPVAETSLIELGGWVYGPGLPTVVFWVRFAGVWRLLLLLSSAPGERHSECVQPVGEDSGARSGDQGEYS